MAASDLPSLIGVIHLPPLAGAPRSSAVDPSELMQSAGMAAVKESQILEKAGFDGIILENFGDVPFFKDQVPPETVASLSVIAAAVREATRLSLGINVLRNDARAALAIAAVTGCELIRVNVHSGLAATDQGLVEGNAAFLMRERERLRASVRVLADIHVKHAKTLSSDDILLAMEEAALRGLADGVIVSGTTTGRPVDLGLLQGVCGAAREHGIPVFVGSGATLENIKEIRAAGARVIVSSALRKGGRAGAPLDPKRVSEFVKKFRQSRVAKKSKPKRASG